MIGTHNVYQLANGDTSDYERLYAHSTHYCHQTVKNTSL